MGEITVRCPFCEKLFLMPRPLFLGERNRTACFACRAEAAQNTKDMRGRARTMTDDEAAKTDPYDLTAAK